ncbi:MAG: hypothetical protein ACUVX9_00830 [Anaerolineae bacterium]
MHYGTSARQSPERVLDLAERFFVSRAGLRLVSREGNALAFAGPQGTVSVQAWPLAAASEVFLTTRGMDAEVRSFMVGIFADIAPEYTGV